MKTLLRTFALAAGAATVLVACASGDSTATAERATPRATPTTSDTPQQRNARRSVVGTVVRFSRGRTAVDVTIRSDHPTSRDFLARLPMRLTIEEFSGKEKISYLPRKLRTAGSPGSDPKNGDLIYFKPWGNLGFYYDASGIDYSDDTINLGSYRATRQQLARLEGGPVTVRALPRSRRCPAPTPGRHPADQWPEHSANGTITPLADELRRPPTDALRDRWTGRTTTTSKDPMPRTISRRRLATLALPVLTAATITSTAPASASTTFAERTNLSTRNLGPLAGAWKMTRLEVGTPGRLQATPYSGQFLFTRSGTGSVQASNPDPNASDTPYTVGGYEAYYGTVDIVRSTTRRGTTRRGTTRGTFGLTIRSAAVRNLIGTRVTRNFVLTRNKLVLAPTNPAEGFRVTYRRFSTLKQDGNPVSRGRHVTDGEYVAARGSERS